MPAPLTSVGPYRIERELGRGGMGVVYLGHDPRLGRAVAIKVLPEHLAATPELRQRFEREARAISSLNHPHICTLYDVGHEGNTEFLVMEYLEGETLSKRIEKGPLAISELLRVAAEIADALDNAHRQGLIHRDLKPGNIMLTKPGAKLLDFGLAKGTARPASVDVFNSPTVSRPIPGTPTTPLTAQGTIVGTFQYMSPEQLEGREADARSDIFSFGAVLYEMATGKQAFEGKSPASLIAAILEHEPAPITELQPMSPPALARVVKTCLAKEPDERFQSAHDLKLQLEWIRDAGSQAGVAAPVTARRKNRERIAWAVAGVLLVATAIFAWEALRPSRAPASSSVLQTSLDLPSGFRPELGNISLALSPDGKTLLVVGTGADGKDRLWVRQMDGGALQPLEGTDNASYPFWSPDSRKIGFFADGKLKETAVGSGIAQTIADAPDPRGASWGPNGTIVFAPKSLGDLYEVPATGGVPVQITKVKNPQVESNRLPYFLPDGRHLLFGSVGISSGTSDQPSGDTGIFLLNLDSKTVEPLLREASNVVYAQPGYLLYYHQGYLMAQPFDAARLRITGPAAAIAQQVAYNFYRWAAQFSASETGLLAYLSGSTTPKSQLTWFDLDGKELGTAGAPASFLTGAISPDGRRAVLTERDESQPFSLWMMDFNRGVHGKFVLDRTGANYGIWSPDGSQVAFTDDAGNIYLKTSDGSAPSRALSSPNREITRWLVSWSPDGRLLAFNSQAGNWRIGIQPVTQGNKPYFFLSGPGNPVGGSFSPDGRWFAYLSEESGQQQLYVTAFPGPGGKWQVSNGGAVQGGWMGRTWKLFYVTPQGHMMAVEVTPHGGDLEFAKSEEIFGGKPLPGRWSVVGLPTANWITGDGKRLLLSVPVGESGSSRISLIVNWTAKLKQQ